MKDVVFIANKTEDFDQAKARVEQLFVASKAQRRGHLAVAQRVEIRLTGLMTMTLWTLSPV